MARRQPPQSTPSFCPRNELGAVAPGARRATGTGTMTQFVAASRSVQQATRATGGDTRSPDNTEIPGRFRGNVENRDNRRVATPLAMDGHQPVEPVFLIGIEIHRSNERRLLELAVQSLADANRLEVRAVPGRARSCLPVAADACRVPVAPELRFGDPSRDPARRGDEEGCRGGLDRERESASTGLERSTCPRSGREPLASQVSRSWTNTTLLYHGSGSVLQSGQSGRRPLKV